MRYISYGLLFQKKIDIEPDIQPPKFCPQDASVELRWEPVMVVAMTSQGFTFSHSHCPSLHPASEIKASRGGSA